MFDCLLPFKDILTLKFFGKFQKFEEMCHITSLLSPSQVALNVSLFSPKTNIKSWLLC